MVGPRRAIGPAHAGGSSLGASTLRLGALRRRPSGGRLLRRWSGVRTRARRREATPDGSFDLRRLSTAPPSPPPVVHPRKRSASKGRRQGWWGQRVCAGRPAISRAQALLLKDSSGPVAAAGLARVVHAAHVGASNGELGLGQLRVVEAHDSAAARKVCVNGAQAEAGRGWGKRGWGASVSTQVKRVQDASTRPAERRLARASRPWRVCAEVHLVCVCGVQGAVALCKPRAVACERVRDACWGTLMQQSSEARVRVGVAQIVGRAWVVRLQRDRRAYSASCQGRMQCAGGGFAVLRSVTRAGETLCAVQALVALLGPRASAGALRSRGMQVAQAHRGHGKCVCVLRVLAVRVACVCAADGRWKRCMRTGATVAPRSPCHAGRAQVTQHAGRTGVHRVW